MTEHQGNVTWQSPSNIALVKYWGKKGPQLPSNPSLSMTLRKASTETTVNFRRTGRPGIEFMFEGRHNKPFGDRIRRFIESITPRHPFLAELEMTIESRNTFPHSSGIASSASAMSALALCICSIREEMEGPFMNREAFFEEASFLSRLGSGSACRSVYGGYVLWGETPKVAASSDQYALPVNDQVHQYFGEMRDAILIVSKKEKKVSSSAGHELMNRHPYASARSLQVNDHLRVLLRSLKEKDLETFLSVTEREALSLHALMMSSSGSYLLLLPGTISIIEKIRDFREQSGIPVCFTLDAGPNVHLLYHTMHKDRVFDFISSDLISDCEGGHWIDDEWGAGPYIIEDEKDQ